MTQSQGTAVRIEPEVQTALDQSRWPTNLALLLLAGLTCGLVVVAGGFDDPRLVHNGWLRLTTLAATLVALGFAANTVCPRRARRMQTAVLLSLVLHILLAVFLHGQHLRRAERDVPPHSPTQVEELTAPQYVEVTDPATPRPFEEPVVASVDGRIVEQVDVSRSDQTRTAPVEVVAAAEPESEMPTATEREREMARAAPRQSETWAHLSRQTREEAVRSSPLELAQESPQVPQEAVQRLQPSSTEAERSTPDRLIVRDREVEPTMTPPEPSMNRDRIPAERPSPQLTQALVEVPRELAPVARAANTAVEEMPVPRTIAESPPQRNLEPQSETMPRQTAQQVVPSDELVPERSVALSERAVRRDRPTATSNPETTLARILEPDHEPLPAEISPQATSLAATPPPSESSAEPPARDLQSQPTDMARTGRPSPSPAPLLEPAEGSRGTAVARTAERPRRSRTSDDPELDRLTASAQPRRMVEQADAVAAPADASVAEAARPQRAASPAGAFDAADTPTGRAAPPAVVQAGARNGDTSIASSDLAAVPSEPRRERSSVDSVRLGPAGVRASPSRRPAEALVRNTMVDLSTVPTVAEPRDAETAVRGTPAPSSAATVARAAPRQESSRGADQLTPTAGEAVGDGVGPAIATAGVIARRVGNADPQRVETMRAAPRSAATARLPRVETSLADLPMTTSTATPGTDEAADVPMLRQDVTSPIGRSELAVDVDIEEDLQEGGLAIAPAASSGSPDRRAQPQSELVRIEPDRFLRRRVGGVAALGGDVRAPAPAFVRRTRRQDEPAPPAAGQPSAKTEAAIELGLVYLARHQMSDGRWSLAYNGVDLARAPRERPQLRADTAATGLALLAFLGAGYDHYDDKYRDVVDRGLRFLIDNQQANGDLYLQEDALSNRFNHFYSHGIAAIALCEAYGMTGDPALRRPAQRAIDYIVATQHPDHGGWRYEPGGVAFSSDLSVTGWQVMALKSGELAGLEVPRKTYDDVRRLLAECLRRENGGPRYVYNPWAASGDETQQHGAKPSTVMTAVGLLLDLYLGSHRDRADLRQGANHLLANLPTHGDEGGIADIGTIGNPGRDTYYWYYATLVMFHMKGEHWQKWNETLHPLLVNSQSQTGRLAGSWNPYRPVRDQWAPHAGRLYVTAMNLLSLEVYYRHLPLYDETGR